MQLPEGKKIYFASDFHLGIPDTKGSQVRERIICQWLDEIKESAYKIYLVGDLFDAWFEYKEVIPKGFSRFFGKIAELVDAGILIEIFTGNHDMWMFDYFQEEFGIPINYHPVTFEMNHKHFYVAHGDGLGPGDNGYKKMKKVMTNRHAQWWYRWLHPDLGMQLANYFSRKGPKHKDKDDRIFLGEDKEWLILYSKELLSQGSDIDYFIYGHRHLPMVLKLNEKGSLYINLGDWINYYTYAVFDGSEVSLIYYTKK